MSEYKNEILEEQHRARQEFIKLKQMQNGQLDTGPKPSEIAYVPKTPKEKFANFLYHYKWYTIAIILIIATITFCTAQCVMKPDFDYRIVYFSKDYATDAHTIAIAEYFEKISEDLDGNGEVNIQVINCSYVGDGSYTQQRSTMMSKLQSIIVSEETALLYITDKVSLNFFNSMAEGGFFESEPLELVDSFYDATNVKEIGPLPKELIIGCRRVEGTMIDGKENVDKIYNEVKRILPEITKK